ncbi:MAG: hypothetical protein JNM18_08175 [Planctomycetaceae bacterium]|nr:hypothetical protein [Planctomycetaceae bacterium]
MAKPSARREPPRIDALRALLLYAETESVTETATRLGVKQPVVSHKLAAFKNARAVGAILIDKQGILTEAARAALPAMRDVVRRYDQLLECLAGRAASADRLCIAVGAFSAQTLLPGVIAEFRNERPDCEIAVRVARGEERILGVAEGRYDVAVVSHPQGLISDIACRLGSQAPKLAVDQLARHVLVAIAARDSEVGRELLREPIETTLPISWLVGKELLGLDRQSGIRRQLEAHFDRIGELQFLVEGGGWQAARELARQGLGVAIVPLDVLADADEKSFVVRRLAATFQSRSVLVYRAEQLRSILNEWCRTAVSVARENQQRTEQQWLQLVDREKGRKRSSARSG